MDAATISALLLGAAGLVGSIATYRSSASKNNLDRVTILLEAQDKRINEQQVRLTEAYSKIDAQSIAIDTQQDDLRSAHQKIENLQQQVNTANRRIRNLQRERDAFHKALSDANVPVPEVLHEEDPAAS